jgi:hypothetical protein
MMFTKYLNQFQKAEAEWVQEVLDMHDGDERKARGAVLAAVQEIIKHRKGEKAELTEFERSVDAACFASRMWWPIGLDRLRELGRIDLRRDG